MNDVFNWSDYVEVYAKQLFSIVWYYLNQFVVVMTTDIGTLLDDAVDALDAPDWLTSALESVADIVGDSFAGELSLLSFVFGSGLVLFVVITFVKWLLSFR